MLKAGLLGLLGTLLAIPALADDSWPPVKLYAPKVCLACIDYGEYLRNEGFVVSMEAMDDMAPVKRRLKVPRALEAEPTAVIGNYFVEGHVPAEDIKEFLKEKPKARGLAVPGLPLGAPGREFSSPTCDTACTVLDQETSGSKRIRRELYDTLLVKPNGDTSIFARH